MAHPYAEHRQHKVESSRAAVLTKGYASGGAAHPDAAQDRKLVKAMVKTKALKVDGQKGTSARLDRYARGGKVKGKGATNVNVIIAPQGGGDHSAPPMPPLSAGAAGGPPSLPAPPPAPAMMKPPMGGPPGMPMRASGGRIKSGPAWAEGLRNGTPVEHTDGKNDTKDIVRPRQVTYAKGGKVEAGKGMGPRMTAGAESGEGRLQKTAMQKRSKR